MEIHIEPLTIRHVEPAAVLFAKNVTDLRKNICALPADMGNPAGVTPYLERVLKNGMGLAALDGGWLAGYLAWLPVRDFRDTGRAAAYVPEWAHSVDDVYAEVVYPQLFDAAARGWAAAGYPIWSVSALSNNHFLEKFLFHSGFGMFLQDAVRPIRFTPERIDTGLEVRRCTAQDAELLAELDAEHCAHYTRPPILMTPRGVETPQSLREFLTDPHNSYWLASLDGKPGGFLRFEKRSHGASSIVRSETTIAISGAYVRPELRGRKAATTLLQHALADYASRGYLTCSVDYETINPQAYGFWNRYFQPVCFSVMRCPEKFL